MVPAGSEGSTRTLSVLVVDDDPATLVLLRKILTQSGFEVDLAKSGTEGLKLALSKEYGAILMDLVMPQPDGQAILRQIADVAPTLLRKIIILTGYPQQAVAANTYAMLIKPLDIPEVLRLVRRCTENG
jgi:DNA-binding NtrC family response regulator